jgi:hypothetical protein
MDTFDTYHFPFSIVPQLSDIVMLYIILLLPIK